MMTEVSLPKSRRRRNSATSTGAALRVKRPLRPARPLDPINVVLGALAEKHRHLLAQVAQAPVAFHQLLPDLPVLAQLDQLADRLAQALDGQGQVVLHQLRLADAQLGPVPPARRGRFPAAETPFPGGPVQLLAGRLDLGKERSASLSSAATSLTAPPLRKVASRPLSVRGFQSRCKA